MPPPATSPKVNLLIINMLVKRSVAGEFHEAQARQYAGKGGCKGVAMSQAVPTRCARRRVRGSGQLSKLGLHPKPWRCAKPSRRPHLFAPRPPDGAAGPCGGTSGAEGLERTRLAAVRDSTECCALLLRTCKRHRTGLAGSGMQVLIPEVPWSRLRKGSLGLEMPNLIQGGRWKGRAGSESRDLSPGRLSEVG